MVTSVVLMKAVIELVTAGVTYEQEALADDRLVRALLIEKKRDKLLVTRQAHRDSLIFMERGNELAGLTSGRARRMRRVLPGLDGLADRFARGEVIRSDEEENALLEVLADRAEEEDENPVPVPKQTALKVWNGEEEEDVEAPWGRTS
jgi:hypothetical protein